MGTLLQPVTSRGLRLFKRRRLRQYFGLRPCNSRRFELRGFDLSNTESGLTLIELIITVTIISILALAAIPIARFQVKRVKERELRYDLWQMRDAIDHYKDAAEKGAFMTKTDSFNYPPDLDTLVNGVDVQDKKVKFLRRIPIDPMTGTAEWGLRSNQDDPDSDDFGGQNVFDVYTKSDGTALDGTKYSTW
jgi:general secretion pathway protein G